MERELEILNSSYWEHFKYDKELAGFLAFDHPKRKRAETECNKLVEQIQELKEKMK